MRNVSLSAGLYCPLSVARDCTDVMREILKLISSGWCSVGDGVLISLSTPDITSHTKLSYQPISQDVESTQSDTLSHLTCEQVLREQTFRMRVSAKVSRLSQGQMFVTRILAVIVQILINEQINKFVSWMSYSEMEARDRIRQKTLLLLTESGLGEVLHVSQ